MGRARWTILFALIVIVCSAGDNSQSDGCFNYYEEESSSGCFGSSSNSADESSGCSGKSDLEKCQDSLSYVRSELSTCRSQKGSCEKEKFSLNSSYDTCSYNAGIWRKDYLDASEQLRTCRKALNRSSSVSVTKVIRVVTVKRGDTVLSLVQSLTVEGSHFRKTFECNSWAIGSNPTIYPGQKIKICGF